MPVRRNFKVNVSRACVEDWRPATADALAGGAAGDWVTAVSVSEPCERPLRATLKLSPINGLKVSAEMLSKNGEVDCANALGRAAPASIVRVARERKLRRVTDMF